MDRARPGGEAQADGGPGTGASHQPYMEDNESSETLSLLSIQKKKTTHIQTTIASEDSHSTIMWAAPSLSLTIVFCPEDNTSSLNTVGLITHSVSNLPWLYWFKAYLTSLYVVTNII